jgi:hypothetical protein
MAGTASSASWPFATRQAFLKSSDHVDAVYEKSHWPVAEQLQKAGVRLAAVLEHALGAP